MTKFAHRGLLMGAYCAFATYDIKWLSVQQNANNQPSYPKVHCITTPRMLRMRADHFLREFLENQDL